MPGIFGAAGAADRDGSMHFFFDTDDGRRRITDNAGIDLPDEAEALEQAVSLLRDLSHGGVVPGAARRLAVRVRGEDGRSTPPRST